MDLDDGEEQPPEEAPARKEPAAQVTAAPVVQASLDDLLDFGGGSTQNSTFTTQTNTTDILNDLLGGGEPVA